MTNRIKCITFFDITPTGVRSHFKESRIPFFDDTGQHIADLPSWHRARNQQRNWETLNQLLALRTLPTEITAPTVEVIDARKCWQFYFEVDSLSAISEADNFASLMLADCNDVPMIVDLDETQPLVSILQPGANIWFELQHGKY